MFWFYFRLIFSLRVIILILFCAIEVTLSLSILQTWEAYNLVWDPNEFGNVTTIRVPVNMVWVPDILMYNR